MKITLSRFVVAAMVSTVFAMLATGSLHAQPPKCDAMITACGCTIGAPGTYMLANELDASQGLTVENGCIDIEGQGIDLYVGYPITGPANTNCLCAPPPAGTGHSQATCTMSRMRPAQPFGVGIHVLPSASDIYIRVGVEVNAICGWNYGVEIEGSDVNLMGTTTKFNNVGVLLNNATDNILEGNASNENLNGFQISGGSGNTINGSTAGRNSQYGFWLDGTQGNRLSGDTAVEDFQAGFYLGCSSKGDVKPLIPCTITTTTGNTLIGDLSEGSTYGIALERKSIYNQIETNVSVRNLTYDMADGNGNCIYNTYLNNVYTTKNLKCIQ